MLIHICTPIPTPIHTHTHLHIFTCTHTYMRMCTHIHRYTYLLSIASGSVWPKSCLFLSLSPDFSKAICSLLLPSIFLHHPLPLSFLPVFLWSLLFLPVSFSSFHSLNNQFSYHPASISSPLLCFSPPLISLISSSKALKFSVFLSLSGGEYTVHLHIETKPEREIRDSFPKNLKMWLWSLKLSKLCWARSLHFFFATKEVEALRDPPPITHSH